MPLIIRAATYISAKAKTSAIIIFRVEGYFLSTTIIETTKNNPPRPYTKPMALPQEDNFPEVNKSLRGINTITKSPTPMIVKIG